MNIAVFGWYHHRNAGDDRMQYCITRWLDGHTLAFLPAGRKPPIHLLQTYDAVIIGGGGIIQSSGGMFSKMTRWIRAAGIPVALVSVSVEGMTSELHRELREFLDICCFAWFRDRGSLEVVGDHPRAFVAPDITWLYPFPLSTPQPTDVAVCLRKMGGLPLADWRAVLRSIPQRLCPWPLYFEQGGDAALLQEVFPDHIVADEFSLGPVQSAGAVISARFHGLLFGMQMGRPVFAVSSLPKTKRFLAENGLEEWGTSEHDPDGLLMSWPKFVDQWPSLTDHVCQIRATMHAEVEEKANQAKKLLLEAAGELPPPNRRWKNRMQEMLDLGSWF